MSTSNSFGTLAQSQSERQWASTAHWLSVVLAFFTSWAAGFAGMLGAVIVYFCKSESPFVQAHAKEAFNFNLSMFLYSVIGWAIVVFTLGIGAIVVVPLAIVLFLVWVICSVIGSMKALNGQRYQYPLTFRFWR